MMEYVHTDKPNHRAKNVKLGLRSKQTLRRSTKTEVADHVFVKAPESLVERHEATRRACMPPTSEAKSLRKQHQNAKKRLLRKEADRVAENEMLADYLFPEEKKEVPAPLTFNGRSECRLSEMMEMATASEAKTLMRSLKVVAADGQKLHYKGKKGDAEKEKRHSKHKHQNFEVDFKRGLL